MKNGSTKIQSGMDVCPNCKTQSYTGGWCFGCGKYRASKVGKVGDKSYNLCEYFGFNYGTRLKINREF